MSIQCIDRVWEHSGQKGAGLLLLLAIAGYAGDNGFAFPGLATLAAKTRLSRRLDPRRRETSPTAAKDREEEESA